jgi:hypothetical protein
MLPGFSAGYSLMKSCNYTLEHFGYPTTKIIPQAMGGGPLCQVCGHGSNTCHMSCNKFRNNRDLYLQCHKNCADEWADCFRECTHFSVPPPAGGADWHCVWNDTIKAYQCA